MIRGHHITIFALVAVAFATLLPLGCGTDGPLCPNVADLATIGSPDAVLTALRDAYVARDLGAYERLLHPEFRFVAVDGTVTPRADDLAATARMFSGKSGVNSAGRATPAVLSIAFPLLVVSEPWTEAANVRAGGVAVRRAVVEYSFSLELADGRLQASGRQLVLVAETEPGTWLLLEQRDLER